MTARPHCTGLTSVGTPCRNTRGLDAEGRCWRHDGRPPLQYKARGPGRTEPKVCVTCNQLRPARAFRVSAATDRNGVPYRVRTCRDCEEKSRRAAGVPKRHQRRDARGNVWCNNCERYLHPDNFKRHPLRPHTYWAYCKACVIEIDRLRYRIKAKTPEGKAAQSARTKRRAAQRKREQRERAEFVRDAITLLRRRGLTKSDISRAADVSLGNLLTWERGENRPDPSVAARLGELLRITADWPPTAEPAYRRRLPHPAADTLAAAMAPVIAAYPIRSRWKGASAP